MVDTKTVIDAFTEMALHYEETVDRELRQFWGVGYYEFIGRLLEKMNLGRAGSVLDVATGRAVIPLALVRRSGWQGRIVGIDITRGMLRGAQGQLGERSGNEHISLICGSGMELPFADGSFDAVVCALATHHMHVPTLLAELRRVLRQGGQLLIADVAMSPFWLSRSGRVMLHTLAWWYGRRDGSARRRAELDALPNMRTPEQWREFIDKAGFRKAELTAIGARRRWYPPGILIDAYSDLEPRGGH